MHPNTDPATVVRTIITHADALAVKLPAAFLKENAALTEIPDRISKYRFERPQLVEAVYAALAEDRDPNADPEVQRHATAGALFNLHISQQLGEVSGRHQVQMLRRHTPALVKAWRPAVQAAADTLGRVMDTLPGVDLADTQAVAGLQPAGMALWGEGRVAVDHLRKVIASWIALTSAAGLIREVSRKHAALILADLSATQLAGIGHDSTHVHEAGAPLALATPEDYTARVERVTREEREGREAAQARARRRLSEEARPNWQPVA